jgi:hypothetical protein
MVWRSCFGWLAEEGRAFSSPPLGASTPLRGARGLGLLPRNGSVRSGRLR